MRMAMLSENNLGSGNNSLSGKFVGKLEASNIENSYAMGTVSSNGDVMGGLVGEASHQASIINSYATVLVSVGW